MLAVATGRRRAVGYKRLPTDRRIGCEYGSLLWTNNAKTEYSEFSYIVYRKKKKTKEIKLENLQVEIFF